MAKHNLKIGDVVRVKEGGWGLPGKDVGKFVEVVAFDTVEDWEGVVVKPFKESITGCDGCRYPVVDYQTFGHDLVFYNHLFSDINAVELLPKGYVKQDVVNKPSHYRLTEGFEVKDLMKLVLDNIESSDMGMTHFQASCYKEMLQYLVRAPLKNGWEDVKKAQFYMNEVLKDA